MLLAAAAVMVVAVATTTAVVVLAPDDEGVELTPPPVSTPAPTAAPPTTLARGGVPEPARAGCSASNWPLPGNSPEEIDSFATLGTPEATAAYIEAKATTCDYDALRTVMADDFGWSTAEPPGADAAVTAWRLQEAHGDPIMYNVVALLRTAAARVRPHDRDDDLEELPADVRFERTPGDRRPWHLALLHTPVIASAVSSRRASKPGAVRSSRSSD